MALDDAACDFHNAEMPGSEKRTDDGLKQARAIIKGE
jgi:hypothetical protein